MFDTDNKENPIVKSILDNLASAINTLKTEIANIDEVYRKKLEEAKASLVACLAETEKQYEYWSNLGDGSIPASAPKKRRSRKAVAEEVVEEPAEKKTEVVDDLPFSDAPEEKVVDLDEQEDKDWEEKIESGELVEVKPEEPVVEELTEKVLEPETATETEAWEETAEEKKDELDDWETEFPEEWK